jgi:hypothetical protein
MVSGQTRLRRLDGWRQIPPCSVDRERRHDASRIGARIVFDGRTDARVCPEIASF